MTATDSSASDVIRATARGRLLSTLLVASAIALLVFFQFFVLPLINTAFSAYPGPQSLVTLKLTYLPASRHLRYCPRSQ